MHRDLTARLLLDDARRLIVDSDRLGDVVELIESLDPGQQDPDTRRIINQLRDKGARDTELAKRLKLVAIQLQDPVERHRVSRIDAVLGAYLQGKPSPNRYVHR
jgi:hypothetical protein